MSEARIGRRALFDVLRGPARHEAPSEEPRPRFSLDAFYDGRRERAEVTRGEIPVVRRREGLVVLDPSPVGTERRPASGAEGADELASSAPIGAHVRIRKHTCLAWQRSFCSTCSERCPERAIVVEQGRPRVEEERCTGCGLCVRLCPAPINGFDIVTKKPEDGSIA